MATGAAAVLVRPARETDVPRILALVHALAEYEREPDAVEATEDDFRTALFGPDPRVHAFVAEVDGEVAGTAVWFVSFSTWRGRHGIWLEDLFVAPDRRGLGLGRALLAELAAECVRRGYARLEWNVLDWNEPALGFYRSLGAESLDEWTMHRLTGTALDAVAASAGTRAGNGPTTVSATGAGTGGSTTSAAAGLGSSTIGDATDVPCNDLLRSADDRTWAEGTQTRGASG